MKRAIQEKIGDNSIRTAKIKTVTPCTVINELTDMILVRSDPADGLEELDLCIASAS